MISIEKIKSFLFRVKQPKNVGALWTFLFYFFLQKSFIINHSFYDLFVWLQGDNNVSMILYDNQENSLPCSV